jgi:hypothetical protein
MYCGSMKLPRFLTRRPAESKAAAEAPGTQELEEQYAAEAATPPSEEPATSEPGHPSSSFRAKQGDIVLAPARQNPVVKERAEVVELHWVGSEEMAAVREPGTEAEPWSVHVGSLEPLPGE